MSEPHAVTIRRALLSVSDKTGLVEFARGLREHGVELLSTGGSWRLLTKNGIEATEISAYTGFPEMMDGRLKTLHPKVHGGILARRGIDDAVTAQHDIAAIDMVVVNLYPFAQTVADPDCSLADAIENIDIGGPTMIRAAAKNHRFVTVLVNSSDYPRVLEEMRCHQGASCHTTRFDLAVRAYEHTAAYDGAIANHFGRLADTGSDAFPRTWSTQFSKVQEMRHGENPHQRAAFYREQPAPATGIASARQLQGKALSYNNVADSDAALECVQQFAQPACVIVKHANPCGVAVAADIGTAWQRAFETDPESAFGGIIAFNRELDGATAAAIIERQFVEVIIAPSISAAALGATAGKKNMRVLAGGDGPGNGSGDSSGNGSGNSSGNGAGNSPDPAAGCFNSTAYDYKRVNGGLLVQDRDLGMVTAEQLTVVSKKQPDSSQLEDLLFAWKVAKFVKSNAIVYAGSGRTIGIGAGQMSRVNSARMAAIKAEQAGLSVAGAVLASDAFFPFRDGIDNAAAAGIAAVIQPGGSLRDEEVIAAADEHDMAMVFTGMRHFRH